MAAPSASTVSSPVSMAQSIGCSSARTSGRSPTAYWKDVDTILMGRKTYEVAAAQRPAKSANAKSAKRRSHNEAAMRTYVFWRTLKSLDEPATELVTGNAVQFVRDLKQRSGKGICLMG